MIAACRFQHVDDDIIEVNFPLASGPVADVENMLTLTQKDLGGQNMTTAEIEAAIDQKGYRRAILAELLVYAKARRNSEDWVWAVALGSSLVQPDSLRGVPYLCMSGYGRALSLYWVSPEYHWNEVYRFLVVRK